MIKLGAKELRNSQPDEEKIARIKRNPVYIVLDNVLDTYNIGAIFRLADAVSVGMVYLCGGTAMPDDPKVGHKIDKASVGTYKWIKWKHVPTALEAVSRISNSKIQMSNKFQIPKSKCQIISVEQDKRSVLYTKAKYEFPLAIVMGHETNGVSKEVLDISDLIVEIPMWGVNKSLNVMVSSAIVLYEIMKRVDRKKRI